MELVDERIRESEVDADTGTAEFERISALVRDSHDGKTRSALRDRLSALIDEIDGLSAQDDEKPPSAKEVLDGADDDELFAFINNELDN